LPDHLKQQEVFSVLDLPRVAETLKRFQFALEGGTQIF
jgi:hypothetical protein